MTPIPNPRPGDEGSSLIINDGTGEWLPPELLKWHPLIAEKRHLWSPALTPVSDYPLYFGIGIILPIVISKDGWVIDGWARVSYAKRFGHDRIWARRLHVELSDDQILHLWNKLHRCSWQ